jgi:leucyl/phenylalanyl-tRNA---protein transferase
MPNWDENKTWISPQMIAAYCNLNALGFAMSAETWQDGKLVGGCYGVKIGRMFYGESMFHQVTDASKVAFVHLVETLKSLHVGMIDCQMKTPLLTSFGGREINRKDFMQRLLKLIE